MGRLIFPLSEKEAEKAKVQYSSEQNKNALFPSRLRELRNDAKLSQEQFSKEIGVTKSTISLYETGDNVPDIKTFTKISDYFGVSYDYLLGKSDSKVRGYIDINKTLGLSDKAIDVLRGYVSRIESESIIEEYKIFGVHTIEIVNTILENDSFDEFLYSFCSSMYFAAKFQEGGGKENMTSMLKDPEFKSRLNDFEAALPKGYTILPSDTVSIYELSVAKKRLESMVLDLQRKYLYKFLKSDKVKEKKKGEDNGNH